MADRLVTDTRYQPLDHATQGLQNHTYWAKDLHDREGPTSEREAVQLGEHVVPAALQVALRAAELEYSGDSWAAHLSGLSRLADLVHYAAGEPDDRHDLESLGGASALLGT